MNTEHPAIPFVDFPWLKTEIQQLKKRILSLPEREMRHSVLVEYCTGLSAEEFVALLFVVQQQAFNGENEARELMQEMALEPSAISQLSYSFLQQAYNLCVEHKLDSLRSLFLSKKERKETVQEAFKDNQFCELPLGLRRQAARTGDRLLLDRLLRDRNWRVIQLLLENPKLIERDIITIVAQRPTRPEILELVAKHSKWSDRYRIRKALVANPYTPFILARQLLGTLLRQDIEELKSLGALSDQLQKEAQIILQEQPSQKNRAKIPQRDLNEIAQLAAELCQELEDIEVDYEEEVEDTEETNDLDALFAQAEQALCTARLVPVGESEEE